MDELEQEVLLLLHESACQVSDEARQFEAGTLGALLPWRLTEWSLLSETRLGLS
jgi:hypothetical protein